jgi:hypothetical protein
MKTFKKKDWIEIVLHLAFWAGVFYILTSLSRPHIRMLRIPSVISDQHEDSVSLYVYLILFFLILLFYGNVFWVFRKAIRYKKGIVRLAIGSVWFSAVFAGNYLVTGPVFKKTTAAGLLPPPGPPFKKDTLDYVIKEDLVLSSPKTDVLSNSGVVNFTISDWQHMQSVILLAFLVILGISLAYFFLKEWVKSELRQTQLQANQFSTEVKFLKSQINPHFLFNTLNNLFSMAQKKGNEELADGISKLSGMMRYMLYDSNAERVTLSTEIRYLEECITLNKLRYADEEVSVNFAYPEQTGDIYIAPMLFIPFVENAFKHGVAIDQNATINISIRITEQTLIFVCENENHSRIQKPLSAGKSGIGLENIKRRLELLYPDRYDLQITQTDEKYQVNLEIKLV